MIIYLFAADGMAGLREMDANLVRPTGFQSAGQNAVIGQLLDHIDMGNGPFPDAAGMSAAASAVAAIADKPGRKRAWHQMAGDHSDVAPDHGMSMELLAKPALGRDGTREDNQATRILVEPLNDSEPGKCTFASSEPFGDGDLCQIFERRGEDSTAIVPFLFGGVSNGVDTGSLLHDDDVFIEITNHQSRSGCSKMNDGRSLQALNDFALFEPAGRIEAKSIIDMNPTGSDKGANLIPGLTRQENAQNRCERFTGVFSRHRIRLWQGRKHTFSINSVRFSVFSFR